MDRGDSLMEAADPGDRFWGHAEIGVELRDQMAPAASEFLRKPRPIDIIWSLPKYPPEMEQTRGSGRGGRQSFRDYVFYDVKPGGPVIGGAGMRCEEPRQSAIEILQSKSAIRKQVHRRGHEHLCADWGEANHHKIPRSESLPDVMAMLQSGDPCASVLGRSLRVRRVDDSMRRSSEVQHDRDFQRRQVPLMQRPGQEALAREVTQDVIAEARCGRPLRSAPAAEIGCMAADLDTGTQSERRKFRRSCLSFLESRSNRLTTSLASEASFGPFPPRCS